MNNFSLVAITLLSLIAMVSIVSVVALKPPDSQIIITAILGFTGPIIAIILANMMKNVQSEVNGRLTQLLQLTERSSRAEGRKEEKDNPNTPVKIVPSDPIKKF